jgi:hypothetical protein
MGLGDLSSIAHGVVAHEPSSERVRASLLSDLSLTDMLGALDGNNSAATTLPGGLFAWPLLTRTRTGIPGGGSGGGAPVRIPETAVFGLFEDDPLEAMWMTTGENGRIQKDEVDEHDVILTLGIEMDHDHANDPDGLVAVVRTPRGDGTEVRLVTARGLKEALSQRGGGAFAVQRLIRPAQHRSAFKNRTRWRKAAPAEAWVVTNVQPVTDTHNGSPGGFLTDATGEDEGTPCSIVHAVGRNGAVAETAAMCGALAEHIEATARPLVRVHELVADFTRDHDGLWYLLQVKAVIATPVGSGVIPGAPNALLPRPATADANQTTLIDGELPMPPAERPTATHTVCCRCCGRRHPPAALSQALTQRMIRSMRTLQRARGVTLSWHRHFAEPEEVAHGKMDDRYGEVRVCGVCYDLYKAEKKLEYAARRFSKRMGIVPDSTEGVADDEWLAEAAQMADLEVQAAGDAGEAAGIEEAAKHAPLEPDERDALEGWRLLVVLHELRGQTETLGALGLSKPGHSLVFSCMGVEVNISLKPASSVGKSSAASADSSLSPSSDSSQNISSTVSAIGRERIGRTTSGKIVMPAVGNGRSAVLIRWHRVFPFFCRRDDPASGGMSTVHESTVAERLRTGADGPGQAAATAAAAAGASVGGISGSGGGVAAAGASIDGSGMLNLRAAVHEMAPVVLYLKSPKGRKRKIAQGQLPLGHLGVERPPELREQYVSLHINSELLLSQGKLSSTTGTPGGGGLVLRLAVGLMRAERVGLESLPLRPLAQANTHHYEEEEDEDDDEDTGPRGPASHVVATELEKLASSWDDLHTIDEDTALDRFRLDSAELSDMGMLSRSQSRTSLPGPCSTVLSSVSEQEFVLWWRRKTMGKERDRRHGAIFVPPPWHCSVDPLPNVWMRSIRTGVPIAGTGYEQGAAVPKPHHTVREEAGATGQRAGGSGGKSVSRRKKRGRRRRRKGSGGSAKQSAGKAGRALAALDGSAGGGTDGVRPPQTTQTIGTDPLTTAAAELLGAQEDGGEEDEGNGNSSEEEEEDEDALEIDSPLSTLDGELELAETDEDVEDQDSKVAEMSDDGSSSAAVVTERQQTTDEPDSQNADRARPGTARRRSKTKDTTRGKRKGGEGRGRGRAAPLARGAAATNSLATASGAPAGTLLYWRVSVAVHGLPPPPAPRAAGDTSDTEAPAESTELILIAEVLGKRLVLKTEPSEEDAERETAEPAADGEAEAPRVGSVVVYGSILELERLLSAPKRGALRGASAACGEMRLTLCARAGAAGRGASYGGMADSAAAAGGEKQQQDEEYEGGASLLRGPWGASAAGDDASSISSIGSGSSSSHAAGGTAQGRGRIIVVGGGSIDLDRLVSGGGELMQSVVIRGGVESGRLQVGVWCDPVHAPAPNMRPSRPIAVSAHPIVITRLATSAGVSVHCCVCVAVPPPPPRHGSVPALTHWRALAQLGESSVCEVAYDGLSAV